MNQLPVSSSSSPNLLFPPGTTFVLSGPSGCGKTFFARQLLERATEVFRDNRATQNILWFYKVWQDMYEGILNKYPHIQFCQFEPTEDFIIEATRPYKHSGGSFVIIDDYSEEVASVLDILFTRLAHHYKINVVILLQNLFYKKMRTVNLNAKIIVLFKNVRDQNQAIYFFRQFAPKYAKALSKKYDEITIPPYSYMLIDLLPETPYNYRVRSNLFPGKDKPYQLVHFPPF